MSDIYKKRWEQHFRNEPWWETHLGMYETVDWEGASEAFEQQIYALAKARGIDTTQTCPTCHQEVDEPACLEPNWKSCEDCEFIDEWHHEQDVKKAKIERLWAKARHLAYLQSLTPAERAYVEAEERQRNRYMINGLICRDVQ